MGPNAITLEQAPAMLASTLPHYKDKGMTKLAREYQRYMFIDEVIVEDTYDVQSGPRVEFRFVTDDNGNARHAGFMEGRSFKINDNVITGSVPWTYADTVIAWHESELLACRNESELLPVVERRMAQELGSMFRMLENRAVLSPDAPDDQVNPPGLQYWYAGLPSGTTNYTGGFLGTTVRYGDGSTITNPGGINLNTTPKARRLVANHNGMTGNTLDTMGYLMILGSFTPPKSLAEYDKSPKARKQKILTGLGYYAEYERLANQTGPDGRNKDLRPWFNGLNFRGVEWCGLPTLDGVALNPIYCTDFSQFKPIVHSNWWMKKTKPMNDRSQVHVWSVQVDCWYSYVMDMPRYAGFSLHAPW